MKDIRHYVFDLYGTLADIHTDEDSSLLWAQMAAWYGAFGACYTGEEMKQDFRRLEAEEVQKMVRMQKAGPEIRIESVFLALFRNQGVEADPALAKTAGRLFRTLSTDYVRLYPGAKELLEALRQQGSVWLLSNAQEIFTRPELEKLGLVPYFRGIYLSSAYGVKKPDPAFFQILLEEQNIRPEEAVMIGNDGTCDIGGARQVGMHTAYLHSNISPDEPAPEADVVLEHMDLAELKKILTEEWK